ncbi:MAG: hypothetical protein GTO24_21055 [candidate division Zixibacteria bacterium]|nr:hypothetical protein [candidate division Zixibacteria bacterium]
MSETRVGTYEIHKANLPALRKRLERLRRKAEKYGLPLPELEVLREYTRKVRDSQGFQTGFTQPVLEVKIKGKSPVLEGGWRLIAVVDHRVVPHDDLGWPIYRLPWEDETPIPEEYRHEAPWCDHCNLVRDRLETFVVLSEDYEWKRVGRTCLKDYTRGVPLHAYAAYLYDLPNIALGLEDDITGGRREYLDTAIYLSHVAAVIDAVGWRSRSEARSDSLGPPATADAALDHLIDGEEVTEAHRETAEAALEWARDDLANKERLNDYEWNLAIAASQQATNVRRIGLIASLIHAWKKATTPQVNENGKVSQHMGEIKERLDLILTVARRFDTEIDAYHGRGTEVLYTHIFHDENGNVFVWKTTARKLSEEWTYKVRGTVKEHGSYNGTLQTVLTRCKVVCAECETEGYWWDSEGYHCAGCDERSRRTI